MIFEFKVVIVNIGGVMIFVGFFECGVDVVRIYSLVGSR